MSKQKKTAGSGSSTTAKKKSSKSIIAEPIDIVNMSGAEIVRRSEEPDTPYYTMEIDKAGNIRQCYGYKNNRAGNPKPPEIKTFEKHYEQYLQEVIHDKRNQRAARQSA